MKKSQMCPKYSRYGLSLHAATSKARFFHQSSQQFVGVRVFRHVIAANTDICLQDLQYSRVDMVKNTQKGLFYSLQNNYTK